MGRDLQGRRREQKSCQIPVLDGMEDAESIPHTRMVPFSSSSKRGQAPPAGRELRRRGLKIPLSVGVILAVVLAACGLYLRSHASVKLTEKDTLLLADFENKTGDPIFDGTLREGLAVHLQQSPFLSLLSGAEGRRAVLVVGLPAGFRI